MCGMRMKKRENDSTDDADSINPPLSLFQQDDSHAILHCTQFTFDATCR